MRTAGFSSAARPRCVSRSTRYCRRVLQARHAISIRLVGRLFQGFIADQPADFLVG